MKTLIIAEKPSLAREIKDMLSTCFNVKWESKGGVYFESEKYYLSSFFGHLLTQYEPADYDEKYKAWRQEDLPIIPDKTQFKYKDDAAERGQLLHMLAEKSHEIVNATDPDREGEGIFRIWYEFEGIRLPTKRLWATSLAVQDLQKAWEKMKDGSTYDALAAAQRCRMEADWLVGMNGSRTYGIITGQKISVGRVQTPTLALIVKRDMEVENYKESYFYTLTGLFTELTFTHVEDGKEVVFETEEAAYRVRGKCTGIKFGLKMFKKERKVQNPPKPFSMPDLQKEANRRFGFGLDKTLKIAQDLYEAKVTSYPRTDSSYLPPADVEKYYAIIDKFGSNPQKSLLIPQGEAVPCMKDTQSAHTAIIPTGEIPGQLSEDEGKVFSLIVERFITAFLKPKVYDQSTITVSDGVHDFRAIVNRVIEAGFTSLLPPKTKPSKDKVDKGNDEELEEEQQETVVDLDETAFQHPQELKNLNIEKKKRVKPKYYTPATLLTAMMTVGKTLENAEDREILKVVEGLGTAATRDKIPVELEKRGYIENSGRNIKSTTKGREFINIVKTDLKSAELTARWEQRLRQMEEGNYNAEDFRSEIRAFVKEIVSISDTEAKKIRAAFESIGYKCPKCGQPLRENKSGFFCGDEQCGFAAWKSIAGKTIPLKEIEALLTKLETGKINGFIAKNGKEFSAKIAIEPPDFKPRFVFDKPELEPYKCPCCEKQLRRGPKVISCNDCGFTLWLVMAGKTLTDSDIKALITKGITGTIKGFKKREGGGSFDAKLTIDPATKKVKYLFADKSSEKLAKKVSV